MRHLIKNKMKKNKTFLELKINIEKEKKNQKVIIDFP